MEDWVAVYKILEKAIIRNCHPDRSREDLDKCQFRKSTRKLDVTYTFDALECPKDASSLPTIRANVSPAKRRSEKVELPVKKEKDEAHDRKLETSQNTDKIEYSADKKSPTERTAWKDNGKESRESWKSKNRRYLQSQDLEHNTLEEYVPDAPPTKKLCSDVKYVPSRKTSLEGIQLSSNEYTPTLSDNKNADEVVRYVPSSVKASCESYEAYEPCPAGLLELSLEYVPNSKGAKPTVEEYQPDFTSDLMKFDDSYVPSSVQSLNENTKKVEKLEKCTSQKHASKYKEAKIKKKVDLLS